ncbi:YopT-type cysteine protease domain-containing protein [Aliikangiella coralliicola]|nr:YopT-type cysteine protease domain-containing protein [Aliikangiella coralliicola]
MSITALAIDHGGRKAATFVQDRGLTRNWRNLIPESQGGVCGGLSLMWLAGKKSGLTSQIFGNSKYSEAVFKFAERAQQLGANNRMGGQVGIDAVAKAFSLTRASVQVNVNDGNVGKWIVNGPSSLVFFAVNGHAVAAKVSKPAVTFFDPNYGVFKFPTTLKFVLFLKDYLTQTGQTSRFLKFYK